MVFLTPIFCLTAGAALAVSQLFDVDERALLSTRT